MVKTFSYRPLYTGLLGQVSKAKNFRSISIPIPKVWNSTTFLNWIEWLLFQSKL